MAINQHWRNFLIENLFAIISIFGGICIYIYVNGCGIGYTYDSQLYVEGAEYFRENSDFKNEAFTYKPPAYSLVISLIGKKGIRLLNGFCLGLSILLFSFIVKDTIKSRLGKWLIVLLFAFGTPIQLVHAFAWTEPLFLSIFLLCLLFILRSSYQKKIPVVKLILLTFLFVMLIMLRHVGLFLVSGIFIASIIMRARDRVSLILPILVALIAFTTWNFFVSDGIAERLDPFSASRYDRLIEQFYFNSLDLLMGIGVWVIPRSLFPDYVLAIIALIVLLPTIRSFTDRRHRNNLRVSKFLFILALVYLVLLILPFRFYPDDVERYLSVVYPLFLIIIFVQIERIIRVAQVNSPLRYSTLR